MISVRLWAPSDVQAVDALRAEARAEISGLRGGPRYPARPLPTIADPAYPVWVGLLEGVVVGFLAASVSGATGVVDAVYVDPGCRGVGVGAALLDQALAWMAAAGCEAADTNVLPGARQTKNFFEEAGFTARLLVVHRRL
jgi:GNAT superfamily N-acetyltransferase